ncbi:hypothetical protein IAT40_003743 [Kwoniella sp. CBS 6097]
MAPKRKAAGEGPSTRTRSTVPSPSPTKRPRTTVTSAIAESGGGRPAPKFNTNSRSATPAKLATVTSKSKKTKYKSKTKSKSIWNSKDDWETLVSESSLSTSSISLRPPRLHGTGNGAKLPSLARCCTRCIARHFKGLWELDGQDFKVAWREVPDKLKEDVRDEVYKWWGGYLTLRLIIDVFMVPPHMYLSGDLLPSIAKTDRLKELIPSDPSTKEAYTSLTLTHADKVTDTGVAGLVYHLSNLERINLKGCINVGARTVKTIVDRCRKLKRVNLKGTGVGEDEVRMILEAFGQQLEGFKVDNVNFENINTTFASAPYPLLTHLSLPGSLLSPAHGLAGSRARLLASSIGYPEARPTPLSSVLQWETLGETFPALTHLYLPGLLVTEGSTIALPPGLAKFSVLPSGFNATTGTSTGGPPIPIETITNLLETQTDTLRSIHLGHLKPSTRGTLASTSNSRSSAFYINAERDFERLGEVLSRCEKLECFRWVNKVGGSLDTGCDLATSRFAGLIYEPGLGGSWRHSLKHLTLVVPQELIAYSFFPHPKYLTQSQGIAQTILDVDGDGKIVPTHELELELKELPRLEPRQEPEFESGPQYSDHEGLTAPATVTQTITNINTDTRSPLETLEIPSANIDDTARFASAISDFRALRTMDLSGTKITDDDMRTIIQSCPLLHRIDLTSCRGAFEDTQPKPN